MEDSGILFSNKRKDKWQNILHAMADTEFLMRGGNNKISSLYINNIGMYAKTNKKMNFIEYISSFPVPKGHLG